MPPMTLDWLHIAALLGAVQGVFLALSLVTQRRNQTANRLLAVVMIAFSIHLASTVYYANGLVQRFPHFFGVSYPLPMLYGPAVYLYAVAASDRNRKLRWRDWSHFVPFLLVVLASAPVYLMSGPEKLAFYSDLQRGIAPLQVKVTDPLKFVSGVAYTAATLIFLRRHLRRVKESYSSVERVNLQWLVWLAMASAAIWALATAFAMIEQVDHPLVRRAEDIVSVSIAVFVYAVGYMALRQPEIFNFAGGDQRYTEPQAPSPAAEAAVVAPVAPLETPAARYERSGLTEREAAALRAALVTAMEKKRLYRNSDLTLADLAEELGTTPHKVSEVLNSELNQTFYDFVNSYRVKDVQHRIAEDQAKKLTILALAMDAGFASKSTFNHVFRQHTGRTPSAYRESLSA